MDEPNRHAAERHKQRDNTERKMTKSPPWEMMPLKTPADGEEVFVAYDRYLARPFQAKWDEANLEWIDQTLFWSYPWYVTPYWRTL